MMNAAAGVRPHRCFCLCRWGPTLCCWDAAWWRSSRSTQWPRGTQTIIPAAPRSQLLWGLMSLVLCFMDRLSILAQTVSLLTHLNAPDLQTSETSALQMCSHWWWSANRVRLISSTWLRLGLVIPVETDTCGKASTTFCHCQLTHVTLRSISAFSDIDSFSCLLFISKTLSLVRQHLKFSLVLTWYLTHSGLDFGLFAVFNLGYSAHDCVRHVHRDQQL